MSAITQPVAARSSSLASSAAFERFAIVFALAAPILYVTCEVANWPLFTYHPQTGNVSLGWVPAVKGQGPAMYWYGWTATMLVGAGVLGLFATILPQSLTRKLPLSLIWVLPLVALPILAYKLSSYWVW